MTKLLSILTVSTFCCFLSSCGEKPVEKKDDKKDQKEEKAAGGG